MRKTPLGLALKDPAARGVAVVIVEMQEAMARMMAMMVLLAPGTRGQAQEGLAAPEVMALGLGMMAVKSQRVMAQKVVAVMVAQDLAATALAGLGLVTQGPIPAAAVTLYLAVPVLMALDRVVHRPATMAVEA